eukprot:scaffold113628_cov36-Phaeocystis_antarctica.AAC.2
MAAQAVAAKAATTAAAVMTVMVMAAAAAAAAAAARAVARRAAAKRAVARALLQSSPTRPHRSHWASTGAPPRTRCAVGSCGCPARPTHTRAALHRSRSPLCTRRAPSSDARLARLRGQS